MKTFKLMAGNLPFTVEIAEQTKIPNWLGVYMLNYDTTISIGLIDVLTGIFPDDRLFAWLGVHLGETVSLRIEEK